MNLWLLRQWTPNLFHLTRSFRSNSALEALAKASEEKTPIIVLYNYPSFSGAFSALFARLFHSHLNLPCLILPFSSVEPLRVEDLCVEGIKKCYFLDFLGPRGFAAELSWRTSCEVIGFDHRKSVLSKISSDHDCSGNLTFHVDIEKSSSTTVYEYFSSKLSKMKYGDVTGDKLYRFNWQGNFLYIYSCLGVRADGNSNLSDEIGKELSIKSAAAGLRPIGAVVYMQRNNLKVCLRSTDTTTDTSEVAKFALLVLNIKAYGGGGSPSSSSFIIRMDEYNQWLSVHQP
ncbi:unnamed protein product [Camellia sinensis]